MRLTTDKPAGATMYVTLHAYLKRLRDLESSKPEERRRYVPTLTEIAADVGITTVAMSNIANNKIRQLSLETGGKIIDAMQKRGFPMEVNDLVAFRVAELDIEP